MNSPPSINSSSIGRRISKVRTDLAKMANTAAAVAILTIATIATLTGVAGKSDTTAAWIKSLRHKTPEKLTNLHFYVHDVVSGVENPSIVTVAKAPTTDASASLFGMVGVVDDPMTSGPALNSTLIGRVQGLAVASSQSEFSLTMSLNYVFTAAGPYQNSSLTVSGRYPVAEAVREMSIVGGTGVFRMARGFVRATTVSHNLTTGDGSFEYNVWVFHY